jgi:hypothetical protein
MRSKRDKAWVYLSSGAVAFRSAALGLSAVNQLKSLHTCFLSLEALAPMGDRLGTLFGNTKMVLFTMRS